VLVDAFVVAAALVSLGAPEHRLLDVALLRRRLVAVRRFDVGGVDVTGRHRRTRSRHVRLLHIIRKRFRLGLVLLADRFAFDDWWLWILVGWPFVVGWLLGGGGGGWALVGPARPGWWAVRPLLLLLIRLD